MADLRRSLPDLVCAAVAVALWAIFRPAIMSPDSIWQYEMALRGVYTDGHPPLMSLALAGFMKAGLGIGALVLVQSLAGCFGVYRAAGLALELFSPSRPEPDARRWLALCVLAALLLPWSPLAFYLVTFWKDSWLLIALSWVLVFALQLWLHTGASPTRRRAIHAALLVAAIVVALHTRLNALSLLPALSILAVVVLRPERAWQACAVAALPAVLFFASDRAIDRAFSVRHVYRGELVMALDLVGALLLRPEMASELPYTNGLVRWTEAPQRYRWGDLFPLYFESPAIVERELVDDRRSNPDLRREYALAWARHPLTLLEVKLRAFAGHLGLEGTHYYFEHTLARNEFGLAQNEQFAGARSALIRLCAGIGGHAWLRWLGAVPAVWLGAGLVWTFASLVAWIRTREARSAFLCLLLAIPLCYFGAYLLATVEHDFRYAYPAMVFVQILLIPRALVEILQALWAASPRSRPS